MNDDRQRIRRRSHEDMPRPRLSRRQAVLLALFAVGGIGFLYFVLPNVAGLTKTVDRLENGSPGWLAAAFVLEVLSFAGYVALFRAVFTGGAARIGWRESYLITMASLVATRLFATAGAGGIALTAWAVRRSGVDRRVVARLMVAFLVLLYAVFGASLVIAGVGLASGLFAGRRSPILTIVPAAFGALALAGAALLGRLPEGDERPEPGAPPAGVTTGLVRRLGLVPATIGAGVRQAIAFVRTRDPMLLGAPAWWGFDIATLWACFHAFGDTPPLGVIWMAYFLGMFGNLLPLPSGIGGVDGGMIGAFLAFGVNANLAIVAVLAYRGMSFWLPTIPGTVAYFRLRAIVNRWRGEAPVGAPPRGEALGVSGAHA